MQYFHASHEFVRPPSFEECAFNEANSRTTHVPHTSNVAARNFAARETMSNAQNNAANVSKEDEKKKKKLKKKLVLHGVHVKWMF